MVFLDSLSLRSILVCFMKDSLIKVFKGWEFDTEVIGAKIIIGVLLLNIQMF